VHGAAAEDQIVPADTSRIGRHELDDPADAAEHPLARTTLLITVRVFVPGPATNTIVPLSVSVPLVAAAAGMAGAAEIASAVPAASSAPFTSRFMLPLLPESAHVFLF
jgi:hypothetical protein